MNEKITLPTLINLLALNTGETKRQSEDFIKSFFAEISDILENGDSIKIKGFGSFKTITVDARRSVDVTTGSSNEIPAHRKVVFAPSKEVAAEINAPFEMFETVEISDKVTFDDVAPASESPSVTSAEQPIQSVSEDANEANAIFDSHSPASSGLDAKEDGAAVAVAETIIETESEPAPLPEPVAPLPEPVAPLVADAENEKSLHDSELAIVEPESEPEPVMDDSVLMNKESENKEEREDVLEDESNVGDTSAPDDTNVQKESKKFAGGFIAGFAAAVIIGAIIFLCIKYVKWEVFFDDDERANTPSVVVEDKPGEDSVNVGMTINDEVNPDETESAAQSDEVNKASEEGKTKDAVDLGAEEKDEVPTAPSDKKKFDTITKTRYLTTMAKDHYGNYHLWPYIYNANRGLGHPDKIRPGTQVVVPDLSTLGIDPNNPSDIAKAKRLGVEIYSRYK